MGSHEAGRCSDIFFRNNLCIGGLEEVIYGRYGTGPGVAIWLPGAKEPIDIDYDAVGTYLSPLAGQVGDVKFNGFDDMRNKTTEKHAVQVDMTVFNGVVFPNPPHPEREVPDLRPLPGSVVIDAALLIPNVNDDYTGDGPDMGAYEAGQDMPIYGPRPDGMDEETSWLNK
jgi:hypothetical protein